MIKTVAQELGYAPPVTFTTNDYLYCLFPGNGKHAFVKKS